MDMHRKATDYAMSNENAKVEMAVQKLGMRVPPASRVQVVPPAGAGSKP